MLLLLSPPGGFCGLMLFHRQAFPLVVVVMQSLSRGGLLRPHGLQPARLLCPWDSPGKNTGVGCHFLLQGIFLTQGLNPVSFFAGRSFTNWALREAPAFPLCSTQYHLADSRTKRNWSRTKKLSQCDSNIMDSVWGQINDFWILHIKYLVYLCRQHLVISSFHAFLIKQTFDAIDQMRQLFCCVLDTYQDFSEIIYVLIFLKILA